MTTEESEAPAARALVATASTPESSAASEGPGDGLLVDETFTAWDAVPPEQLRQLEAPARARMADPEYRRRIEATDVWVRRIVEEQR